MNYIELRHLVKLQNEIPESLQAATGMLNYRMDKLCYEIFRIINIKKIVDILKEYFIKDGKK